MRLILLFSMVLFFYGVSAQSRKHKREEKPTESFYPQAEQAPKTTKKKSGKPTYDARERSFDRHEQNWKLGEKKEKKLSRHLEKDYSTAPYFGHKRPPKIRPVGKRKVCNVCGITH